MRFRETVIVSGGLLTQQITVFVTSILIARYLGVEGFGELSTLKGLSTFLLIVTPLGLDLALLKHAGLFQDRPMELRAVSNVLRWLVGALNIVILLLTLVWIGPGLQEIYSNISGFSNLCVITMLGLVFAADVQISGALYRVADRVTPYSLIVNYCQPVARLVVSYAALAMGGSVQSVVVVNSGMFLLAFAMIATDQRAFRLGPIRYEWRNLRQRVSAILAESVWMALLLVVYQAMRFVDILVLAALTTTKTTGDYTAMSNVAQLIQIYPNAISQTLGPRIAMLFRDGDFAGISVTLQDYMRKATLLGGFLFGGVAVFGADLDLVFGQAFDFQWQLAVLLAAGWFISATLAPFGYVLSMTGRHRQELAILSAGAGLLVACLLLFVPRLGSIGAALSVFMAFVAVNTARSFYVISILRTNPLRWRDILPPVCFAGVALLCSALDHVLVGRSFLHLVLECLAYAVLATGLYAVGFASRQERNMMVRSVVRLVGAR